MGIKALEKSNDNLNNTIKWGAAFYKYLKEIIQNLESVQRNITTESAKKDYRKARSNFRWVRRCERRVNKYYSQLKKNLAELMKILPESLRGELKEIQEKLRPHEVKLIRETSFFRGKQIENFDSIGVQLQLAQGKGGNPAAAQAAIERSIAPFKELLAYSGSRGNVGLTPFLAELQSLKKFIAKLESMSQ